MQNPSFFIWFQESQFGSIPPSPPPPPPPKNTWPTFLKILFQTTKINQAACDLAKGVAQEGGALFAGSICQTASLYSSGAGQKVVKEKFREQIEIFLQNDVDLLIAEVNIV